MRLSARGDSDLPDHALKDSTQAQRDRALPPEALIQLLQTHTHRTVSPAVIDDQRTPEVYLPVPVCAVNISVLFEGREQESHPLVILPVRGEPRIPLLH